MHKKLRDRDASGGERRHWEATHSLHHTHALKYVYVLHIIQEYIIYICICIIHEYIIYICTMYYSCICIYSCITYIVLSMNIFPILSIVYIYYILYK